MIERHGLIKFQGKDVSIQGKDLQIGDIAPEFLATNQDWEEIAILKNKPGKDILVYGGAGFVGELIAGGHIDEFYFFLIPIMINKGVKFFYLPGKRQQLTLINATSYDNGVAVLHYKLNKV